jgi:hypothetical protein
MKILKVNLFLLSALIINTYATKYSLKLSPTQANETSVDPHVHISLQALKNRTSSSTNPNYHFPTLNPG